MKNELNINIKLVAFAIKNYNLCVFLEKNKLPSAKLKDAINLKQSVKQIFANSLHATLDHYYFEQLYTVSDEKETIISIIYFILIDNPGSNNWYEVKNVRASGDREVIAYAVQRLRWKIEYTNVVYSLLPQEFTLSELQKTYEAILGQYLDKRNFRKKILTLNFLKTTERKKIGATRPAQMYSFKKREPIIIKVFS